MGDFSCPRCQGYCCSCSGCHAATAIDGTQGCTRCNPGYEQGLTASIPAALTSITQVQNINRPRNIFTHTQYGKPQITYRRN